MHGIFHEIPVEVYVWKFSHEVPNEVFVWDFLMKFQMKFMYGVFS